jgi:hypothetical protein
MVLGSSHEECGHTAGFPASDVRGRQRPLIPLERTLAVLRFTQVVQACRDLGQIVGAFTTVDETSADPIPTPRVSLPAQCGQGLTGRDAASESADGPSLLEQSDGKVPLPLAHLLPNRVTRPAGGHEMPPV